MAEQSKELWQAVDDLRARNNALEVQIATHVAKHEAFLTEFRESRQERREQMQLIAVKLAGFDAKIDGFQAKVTEAHGAAKFGKWLLATVIAGGALFIKLNGG